MDGNSEDMYPVKWEGNLFLTYCDLYETVREWLLSGAGIHLDEVIEDIRDLENFEEATDIDEIKKHSVLMPHYKKICETMSTIREKYHSYFSNEKMDETMLRDMMDEIRDLVGDMQRGIGVLQSVTEGIEDIGERMGLRECIKNLIHMKKRIVNFNNSFSYVKGIEWNVGYSKTHIYVTPKSGSVYHPIKSKLMEIRITGGTEIDITVTKDSINAKINGELYLNFFASGKIPEIHVEKLIIDRKEGVEIFGDGVHICIKKTEEGETKSSVVYDKDNQC
ncbi:MAG: hypothetical protein U9O96_04020 [Candidatus Thermoplasmatota archaeon]|nr:hypothetical protein [Candidatus Thermoplasmatota archaeon]